MVSQGTVFCASVTEVTSAPKKHVRKVALVDHSFYLFGVSRLQRYDLFLAELGRALAANASTLGHCLSLDSFANETRSRTGIVAERRVAKRVVHHDEAKSSSRPSIIHRHRADANGLMLRDTICVFCLRHFGEHTSERTRRFARYFTRQRDKFRTL